MVDGRVLDGRTQWFLRLIAHGAQKPLPELGVAKARADLDIFLNVMGGRLAPVGEIIDRTIPGPAGRLRVRQYRPAGSGSRPLPTIVYFHGGGFVIGSLEAYDLPCRYFCAETGCAVVAVDYRLAPEHKFPAAIDDAVAAYRWFASEASGMGIDRERLVVAGDSAGGTIAAVLAQQLRGFAHPPCLQWLIYPPTDLAGATHSHESCAARFLMKREDLEWFCDQYLNRQEEAADPRVSPLRAADLSNLPPALIFTAGFDPLRDEGRAYADRLAAEGVRTTHREFDSLIHGFITMRGILQAAARAMDEMAASVRYEIAKLER